jgi:hypothetical protein
MNTEQKTKAEWSWRIVMGVMAAVTMLLVSGVAWGARDIYHKQSSFNEAVDQRIRHLEVFRAELTVNDWSQAKAMFDERTITLDKRVTRTEDAVLGMKESLVRIENKLDKLTTEKH